MNTGQRVGLILLLLALLIVLGAIQVGENPFLKGAVLLLAVCAGGAGTVSLSLGGLVSKRHRDDDHIG